MINLFRIGLVLFIFLIGATRVQAGYFQDTNSVRKNQIYGFGGYFRPDAMLGLGYQRQIHLNIFLTGYGGFSLIDGGVFGGGTQMIWRQQYRFRPVALATLTKTTGLSIQNSETTTFKINGQRVDLKSDRALSISLRGGFQFRIWKGLVLQYSLGWRHYLMKQNIRVTNVSDPDEMNDFINNHEESGFSLASKGVWEF